MVWCVPDQIPPDHNYEMERKYWMAKVIAEAKLMDGWMANIVGPCGRRRLQEVK